MKGKKEAETCGILKGNRWGDSRVCARASHCAHLVPYISTAFLIELYNLHDGLWVLFLFGAGNAGFLEKLLPFLGETGELAGGGIEADMGKMNGIIRGTDFWFFGCLKELWDHGSKETLFVLGGACSSHSGTRTGRSSGVDDNGTVAAASQIVCLWEGINGRIRLRLGRCLIHIVECGGVGAGWAGGDLLGGRGWVGSKWVDMLGLTFAARTRLGQGGMALCGRPRAGGR